MRVAFYVAVMSLVANSHSFAQSGITGTWRAEGVGSGSWTIVLKAEARRLSGRVSSCTSLPVEIYEAVIQANAIRFKCQSPGGQRVITLSGTVNGDEIVFSWAKEIREVGAELPADRTLDVQDVNASVMFGPSTPERFIVKRVPDRGVEFAAALNLRQEEVKIEGTLFLPPNVDHVRAVIVLLNSGTSWEGMGGALYRDSQLRTLSATLNVALLLPRITNIVQSDRGLGAVDVLRNAALGLNKGVGMLMQRLAEDSGHGELVNAPMLLWGHSRSGHLATTLAALRPDRTIAFVHYHAGGGGLGGPDLLLLRRIPALLLEARGDIETNKKRPDWPRGGFAETGWRNGRLLGAPWTYGVEPDAAHQNPADLKTANALVIPWITAVLGQRLSRDGSLLSVESVSAWSGNVRTGEIAPGTTREWLVEETSWLPDAESARAWRAVVSGSTK